MPLIFDNVCWQFLSFIIEWMQVLRLFFTVNELKELWRNTNCLLRQVWYSSTWEKKCVPFFTATSDSRFFRREMIGETSTRRTRNWIGNNSSNEFFFHSARKDGSRIPEMALLAFNPCSLFYIKDKKLKKCHFLHMSSSPHNSSSKAFHKENPC